MKLQLSSLFFMLVLSSCATQSPYKPAHGAGTGYKDSVISTNQYRVHFKMRNDDRAKAMDFALLRAAELTLEKGYDWFVVNDRQTVAEKERHYPSVGVGVGTSTRRNRGGHGVGLGFDYSSDRDEIESILEIQMGKGVRPAEKNSYNALEVRANLRSTHGLAK